MTDPRFSAAADPWVLTTANDSGGSTREVSLRDVFADNGELAGLSGEPPVVIATLRLLTAIAIDACGIPDQATWDKWWAAGGVPAPSFSQ